MNEIHYMVTVEDIAHLNHHHFRSSPRARRGSFLRVAGSIGMLFLSYFAFMAMLGVNTPGIMIFALMFMIGSFTHAYTRKKPNRAFVRRVKNLFGDGRNVSLFGQHHLLLHEEHVEVRTPYSQGTIRWEAIERVEQDEEYIFIYTSSLNAHIIHKRFFPTPGHAQAFFELAHRLHQGSLQLTHQAPLMLLAPQPPYQAPQQHQQPYESPAQQRPAPSAQGRRLGQEAASQGIDGSI